MIAEVEQALADAADPVQAAQLEKYFQVRPGGYGEGDIFIGVRVSALRKIVAPWYRLPYRSEMWLDHLRHDVHEHRLAALIVMAERAKRGDAGELELVAQDYLAHTDMINNWDLVDCSCAPIVGRYVAAGDRGLLDDLARSTSLWERRIAMVTTHHFLRAGSSADTYRIAELLIGDREDLIHKAVGWMLREAGHRVSGAELRDWLDEWAARLPRTALRYAIEHFDAAERGYWLTSSRG